jgi:hypothetical protein
MRRPIPADFAPPPSAARHLAWEEADRAARPARLARLRANLAAGGLDAYFGLRREEIRYLAGVVLGEGEEKVAGHSGRFLVSGDALVVLADSRYTVQARHEAPDARLEPVTYDLPARWAELCASIGARRVAVPAADVSHALWGELAAAAPGVELVPAEAWVDADRAVKEPAEVERIEAACAVADRALQRSSRDPARHHRGEAGLAARGPDPDRRRRGAGVRRRLPGRARGGTAPRLARRSRRCGPARSCCSTSGPRWPAIAAT